MNVLTGGCSTARSCWGGRGGAAGSRSGAGSRAGGVVGDAGAGAAAADSTVGASSGGGEPCSSAARAGLGSSPFSAWRWAASVARKSSARGPSRMLARRRAIEHLLCELAVRLGGGTARVVLQHRSALHGRLRVAHSLANARIEDQVPEVLLQHLDRLTAVQGP